MIKFRNTKKCGGVFKTAIKPWEHGPHDLDLCVVCHTNVPGKMKQIIKLRNMAIYGDEAVFRFNVNEHETTENDVLTCFMNATKEIRSDFLSQILSHLKEDELLLLANKLGKLQGKPISDDANALKTFYHSLPSLKAMDLNPWLTSRNKVLMSIICGILDKGDLNNLHENELFTISIIIEQIYNLRFNKLVLPTSFLLNLYIYMITGSKMCVDAMSSILPCGSYGTVRNWLQNLSADQIQYPTEGSLMNVFDNSQVIGKKHGIRPGNKVNSSVMTMKAYTVLSVNKIQEDHDLSPSECFPSTTLTGYEDRVRELSNNDVHGNRLVAQRNFDKFNSVVNDMVNQNTPFYTDLEAYHLEIFQQFLEYYIEEVFQEFEKCDKSSKIKDDVDWNLEKESQMTDDIICINCGHVWGKRKRKCDNCKEKLVKNKSEDELPITNHSRKKFHSLWERETQTVQPEKGEQQIFIEDRYPHFVKSQHEESKFLTVTDPVLVNPNSAESLALVLRQIGKDNYINR